MESRTVESQPKVEIQENVGGQWKVSWLEGQENDWMSFPVVSLLYFQWLGCIFKAYNCKAYT